MREGVREGEAPLPPTYSRCKEEDGATAPVGDACAPLCGPTTTVPRRRVPEEELGLEGLAPPPPPPPTPPPSRLAGTLRLEVDTTMRGREGAMGEKAGSLRLLLRSALGGGGPVDQASRRVGLTLEATLGPRGTACTTRSCSRAGGSTSMRSLSTVTLALCAGLWGRKEDVSIDDADNMSPGPCTGLVRDPAAIARAPDPNAGLATMVTTAGGLPSAR